MDLYHVIGPNIHNRVNLDLFKNTQMNLLFKYKDKKEYGMLNGFKKIKLLVDSGAFGWNNYNKIDPLKVKEYIDEYSEFIKQTTHDKRITGYFDFDVIDIGLNNIKNIRNHLFNVSDKIIPVYHVQYGGVEFKRMCKQYDYIAIGCSCNGEIKREYYGKLVHFAHKYHCKIHGLAMNDNRIMKKVPFNSVDSTGWISKAYWDYYTNTNFTHTKEENIKYRPLWERKSLVNEIKRARHFKRLWANYDRKCGFLN